MFPDAFDPFTVEDRLEKVQAAVDALRQSNVKVVVVMGHDGATAGTLTAPTSRLIELADELENVDAVIGDHTNFQVLTTRPNGILVTENLEGRGSTASGSCWTRHRRRRLQDRRLPQAVEHRRHPEPAIQARVDALTAEIAPELNKTVGNGSTVAIPRSDVCLRVDGRLCESLIGDVVTDSCTAYTGVDFGITNFALARRADVSDDGHPDGLLPGVHAAAVPDHEGTGADGSSVREHGPDGDDSRHLAEDDAGERRVVDARGERPLPAGVRASFTYNIEAAVGSRVTGAVRQAADGTHRHGCRFRGWRLLPHRHERLHGAFGGDGYPNLVPQLDTPSPINTMDERLMTYLAGAGTIRLPSRAGSSASIRTPGVGNDCLGWSP